MLSPGWSPSALPPPPLAAAAHKVAQPRAWVLAGFVQLREDRLTLVTSSHNAGHADSELNLRGRRHWNLSRALKGLNWPQAGSVDNHP